MKIAARDPVAFEAVTAFTFGQKIGADYSWPVLLKMPHYKVVLLLICMGAQAEAQQSTNFKSNAYAKMGIKPAEGARI